MRLEALAHELERGSGDVGDVGRELLEDTEPSADPGTIVPVSPVTCRLLGELDGCSSHRERGDSGTCHNEITRTSAAKGILMKNIQCQEACSINHPPKTGPKAVVMVVNPAHVPIALPKFF